ncbi:hypothetical protein [Pendulispora rubella]
MACVLLLGLASCEQAPARKPPAEVPISEYRVEGPAPEAPPPEGKDDAGSTPPLATSGLEGKTEGSTTPATKLDAKNGFAGVQLGAAFKSFRNLKESERSGDHITYKMLRGTPSYGGIALKDVSYTFNKGKLDTIVFSVKANKDCKAMKESLERELGAPQSTSAQAQVWKGEKVGLRFAISPNSSCGGSVVSRELADAISWAGLQP